jgi:glycosyltransferase involved in cell wall biosynthesis
MRVLHVISSGGMYGAEAVVVNLCRCLNAEGHFSALAVFENALEPNIEVYDRARAMGISAHLIPCGGRLDRRAIATLRELGARLGADIVHAHGYKADVYVYLAFRNRHIPLFSTCHNWLDDGAVVSLYGVLDRLVLKRFTSVIAVSEEVRQRLLKAGVDEQKVRFIRNGIDLRPFAAIRASLHDSGACRRPIVVGLVGRLSREKGVDVFLRAAARVLMVLPEIKFLVVGDGPDRKELERFVDDLNIRSSVSLPGKRDDMAEIYASMDIFVSASRQEGLPLAILEAMASGLAIVATAVGEVPRVICDGVTGLLVPPELPDRLAEGIVELSCRLERREELSRNGRRLVQEQFSAEQMARDYLLRYEEVGVEAAT